MYPDESRAGGVGLPPCIASDFLMTGGNVNLRLRKPALKSSRGN